MKNVFQKSRDGGGLAATKTLVIYVYITLVFSYRISFKKSNIRLRIFGKIS
jgi:hypothetical protein